MEFDAKTEKQIVEEMVWPKGEYDFEVIACKQKTSQRGNDMFEVHLRISDTKGNSKVIKDYLLPQFAMKFKRAMEAMGLEQQYMQGCVDDDDLVGKTGRIKMIIERDRAKRFRDRNAVDDYLKSWRTAA